MMAKITRCLGLLSTLSVCTVLVFGCDSQVTDGLLRSKRENTISNTDTTSKKDTTSELDTTSETDSVENEESNASGQRYCAGKRYNNHKFYCKDGRIRKCRVICGGMEIAYCVEQCPFFYNCRWQPIGVEDPVECQKYFPSYRRNILPPRSANDGPKSTETTPLKDVEPDGVNAAADAAAENTDERPHKFKTDEIQGLLTEIEKQSDVPNEGISITIIVLLVLLIIIVSVGFIKIYLRLKRLQTASPGLRVDAPVANDGEAQLGLHEQDPNRRFWRRPSETDPDENVEDETWQFIPEAKVIYNNVTQSSETETVEMKRILRRQSLPQLRKRSLSQGGPPTIILEEKGLLEANPDSGDEA